MNWPHVDLAEHRLELEGRAIADGVPVAERAAAVERALRLEAGIGEAMLRAAPKTTTGRQNSLFGGSDGR